MEDHNDDAEAVTPTEAERRKRLIDDALATLPKDENGTPVLIDAPTPPAPVPPTPKPVVRSAGSNIFTVAKARPLSLSVNHNPPITISSGGKDHVVMFESGITHVAVLLRACGVDPVQGKRYTIAVAEYVKPKKPKPKSRGERWAEAASDAKSALEELKSVQDEFEEWKNNIEERFSGTATYEKLDTLCNIDIQSALDAADEAESADIPVGFGRD